MSNVSESRFNMWRAVFAMAHADNVVTVQERAFMENYLKQVPFSPRQAEALRQDMEEAQDVNEMFAQIVEPEDYAAFFQFARELVWSDGDMAAQEEAIKERLKAEYMDKFDLKRLERELAQSRAGAQEEREADKTDGVVSFLKKMITGGRK